MKTGGEHTAHAIRRGPDGWLYVLCGNNTGIDKSYAELPTSPIKEPIAGCVLRFQPDLKKCEIVAHGFRNAYGMDFNLDGELFTFDSDNERCVAALVRADALLSRHRGRHYGWLSRRSGPSFWRRPPYFCDVVAADRHLGRGSPTGVACYRAQPVSRRISRRLLPVRLDLRQDPLRQARTQRRQLRSRARASSSKRSATTASPRPRAPSIRRPAICTSASAAAARAARSIAFGTRSDSRR